MPLAPEQTLAVDRIVDDLRLVDPKVVNQALEALVAQGTVTLPYLRQLLRDEPDEAARINLIRGIGNLCFEYDVEDGPIADDLVAAMNGGEISVYERATIAKNLGKIGGGGVVATVSEAADHADTRVRANALESFSYLAQRGRGFGGEATVSLLRLRQHDSHPRVKVNATLALYFIFGRQQEQCLGFLRDLQSSTDDGEMVSARTAIEVFHLEKDAVAERFAADSLFRTFLQFNILNFYK